MDNAAIKYEFQKAYSLLGQC